MNDFLVIGSNVRPIEMTTFNGHSSGVVVDLWIDETTEFAEVRWSSGDLGTWPTEELTQVS